MVRLTEEKKTEILQLVDKQMREGVALWIAATFDILNANKEPEDEKNKELFKIITPKLLAYNNDHNCNNNDNNKVTETIPLWLGVTFDILNSNKAPEDEKNKQLFEIITPKLLKFNDEVLSMVKLRIKSVVGGTQTMFGQMKKDKLNVEEFTKHKMEEEEKMKTMTDNSNKRMDEMEKIKLNVTDFTVHKIEQQQQFIDLGRRINTASGVVNGKLHV
jgi:hypothetical protein